jgi:hypothetical protein
MVLLAALFATGCTADPPAPAGPNPFVAEFRFETIEQRRPIGADFSFHHSRGQFAEFTIIPRPNLPTDYGGRPVREIADWPITVVIYPHGEHYMSEEAFWLGCMRYPDKQGRQNVRMTPLLPSRLGWYEAGFKQNLRRPAGLEDDDKIVAWTYLAVPPELIGDWIYEVIAFPAHTGTGFLNYELGEPVVVQRGEFHILR